LSSARSCPCANQTAVDGVVQQFALPHERLRLRIIKALRGVRIEFVEVILPVVDGDCGFVPSIIVCIEDQGVTGRERGLTDRYA